MSSIVLCLLKIENLVPFTHKGRDYKPALPPKLPAACLALLLTALVIDNEMIRVIRFVRIQLSGTDSPSLLHRFPPSAALFKRRQRLLFPIIKHSRLTYLKSTLLN
jgi:hypothetical protein